MWGIPRDPKSPLCKGRIFYAIIESMAAPKKKKTTKAPVSPVVSEAVINTQKTLFQALFSRQTWKSPKFAKIRAFLAVLPPDMPFLAVLWLVPLAVYLKTLPSSLYFIDAGVTLAAAYTLGIPTPPGYPTTTLIGHLFTLLPVGEPLFRLQLFSISCALGLLTLMYFFIKKIFDSRWIAFGASFMLAFSYQLWSQTLNVQPYTFTDLMLMTVMFLVLHLKRDIKTITKLGLIGAVLLALAAGGSTVMVFMIVPAVLVVAVRYWNDVGLGKTTLLAIIAVLGVALLYSYLPVRAMQRPFLNWGNPQTPELFMAHVQGLGLSFNDPTTNKVTGFTGSPSAFIQVVGRYFYLLWYQFTPLALPLLVAGFYYFWKKKRELFWLLGSIPLTNMIFGGLWLSGNQETWFLLSYIVFTIFMAGGMVWLLELKKFRLYMPYVLAVVVIAPLIWWSGTLDRSSDYAMRDYSDNLYAHLPKNTVLIGIYDTFQASTLDHHELRRDRTDVFPVMTNMIYVLPWYREHLEALKPGILPEDIDRYTTFSRETEYNEMLNYYISWLIKQGYPVYVTQPVFNRSVLVGSNAGVFTPDPAKLKAIPDGLVMRMVAVEPPTDPTKSATEPAAEKPKVDETVKEEHFQYYFRNPEQYKKPFYYLEKGYESSYQDLVAEYSLSYIALAEELLKEKPAPLGGGNSALGGLAGLGGGNSVNLSGATAISPENKNKAAAYLQQAYDMAPDSLEVINRLAIAYANQGQFIKTVEFFQKAVDKDPSNLSLQFNLAKASLDNGDEKKAKDIFRNILQKVSSADPVARQASSMLSAINAGNQAPLNWQTFTNDTMNLKFFYPEGFAVSFSGENMIKLTNNGKELDELTFLMYSKKLTAGENIEDIGVTLPFVMDGVSLGSQPVQIPGFQGKVKTYATGEKTNLLFLLRHNDQGFAIRVNPGNSTKAQEFGGILQSIRVLKP